MHVMDRIRELVERKTPDILRAEAMGFIFYPPQVLDSAEFSGFIVHGLFQCVCGRYESYSFAFCDLPYMSDEILALECDIGARLRKFGSFSREHLVRDGYTPEQIEAILAKGDGVCA